MDFSLKNIIEHKKDFAGTLLFLAGLIIFMGIITAEIYYPASYSTRNNEISDLGITKQLNTTINHPSAAIFNTIMIIAGIMIVLSSFFIHMHYQIWYVSIPLAAMGFGTLGAGIFPESFSPLHSIFAFIIFISGCVSALTSTKITRFPINIIFIFLGVLALFFLFFDYAITPYLGAGGLERWIFYPILFAITGLGAFLLGKNK